MTAFGVRAVIVCLLMLAPVGIADRLRLLWDLFG